MAAVLAAGSGAVLSHRSALDLHAVRPMSRARHEVTRVTGSAIRTVEVLRARSLPPEDVTTVRGIPVTTLVRALCDCTPILSDQALARCIHEAEILRIFDAGRFATRPSDSPPYEVDVLFPAQKVIVELDDRRTHRTARAFERDRERDTALIAQGYRTLRFTDQRLKRNPAGAVTDLRATLRAAAGSPVP